MGGGQSTPRTLHVIDSLGPGGAEHSLVELLVALRPSLDPAIAVFKTRPDDAALTARAQAARIPVHVVTRTGLRRVIKRLRPDVVHTTLVASDIATRLAAWRTGIPVVTSLVNTTYDRVRRSDPAVSSPKLSLVQAVDGWTARRLTTSFHAITEAVRDAAVRDLRIDPARVTVIPRGRDTRRLGAPSAARRASTRAALGIDEDSPVIVTVGRQEFQKGHDVLYAAAARLAPRHTNLVVLHAGREGAFSPALRRLLEQTRADVRVLGHRDDVADLVTAADVFAFPSRYEGLGGAVLEAMALGVPVVASDLPALREILAPAGQALVPPDDPAALADAMARLLDDDRLRSDLGRRARDEFLARYTLDAVAPQMHRFLVDAAHTVPASWR